MKPLVSVIIPAFNRANILKNAIESVQAQTHTQWEAIVVDDGSKDNTCDVVSGMAQDDGRIRLVRHEENRKAQAARNTGIRAAKGEWIAFLDSDDEYLPDSIEKRLETALKENVHIVHSDCFIIKPGKEKELYGIRPLAGNVYREMLEKEGPVFPALFVSKKVLEEIGLLDEKIKAYQEWDTTIRLAKNNAFGFYPEPTFIYDYRCEDAMSRDSVQNGKGYEQIVHKHFIEIWKYLGMKGLAFHYDKAAKWYKEGKDFWNTWRCKIFATLCKCLSFKMISDKLKVMALKKAY